MTEPSASRPIRAPAGQDAWARADGRGRGAARPPAAAPVPDPDLASRRPPAGPFAARPAAPRRRRGRVAAGVTLLVAAVGLLVFGLLGRGSGPDAPVPEPALATFDLAAGWADRTAELAPRVTGVRPSYVFSGPVTGGFAADLNVVRQPRAPGDPALDRLVDVVSARVRSDLEASAVGARRRLALGGEPALAYDYRYTAGGVLLRARQVAAYRGDSVVFLNFTVAERAFTRDVRALDRLVASWRWS